MVGSYFSRRAMRPRTTANWTATINRVTRRFVWVLLQLHLLLLPYQKSLLEQGPWACQALSNPHYVIAPRHVCLLDSYPGTIEGSYFSALLDQLIKRASVSSRSNDDVIRLVFCYTQTDLNTATTTASMDDYVSEHVQQIRDAVGLHSDSSNCGCHVMALEEYTPLTLEQQFQDWWGGQLPTILWVWGTNAFGLRYRLRTSGLDRWITRHCAGTTMGDGCVLYVGEGAGALCAGASLRVAHYCTYPPSPLLVEGGLLAPHDAQAVPEPQFFGLGLLEPDRTVAFASLKDVDEEKERNWRSHHPDLATSKLTLLKPDRVFVWSQSPGSGDSGDSHTSVMSFVFLPAQRGMMEQIASPEPLPPLWIDKVPESATQEGGVACFGEPSVDPSRQLQSIGDSEWMEDESYIHGQ